MILMVTKKAVTVREYRFRLVQRCKNAVKCRLSGDEILKISVIGEVFFGLTNYINHTAKTTTVGGHKVACSLQRR